MTNKKAAVSGFNLASLDTSKASDKGARVQLRTVNGDDTGVFITVLGKHSQVFRDHVKDSVDEQQKASFEAQRRGKKPPIKTAHKMEQEALELLVLCTLGWETEFRNEKGELIETKPIMILGDEELPFNAANALRVYSEIIPVREQVDEAIGDLENFIVN